MPWYYCEFCNKNIQVSQGEILCTLQGKQVIESVAIKLNINIRNTNKAIREGKPSTLKQADRFQKHSIQESKSLFCEMCGEENQEKTDRIDG